MPRRAMTYLLLIGAALSLSACGYSAAAAEEDSGGPATVESIEDSDLSKVVLQPSAAKRIGLETTTVANGAVDRSLVVPGTVVAADGGGSMAVRVTLPGASAGSVDTSRPARILGVGGQDGLVAPAQAPPPGQAGAAGRATTASTARRPPTWASACASSWRRRAGASARPFRTRR